MGKKRRNEFASVIYIIIYIKIHWVEVYTRCVLMSNALLNKEGITTTYSIKLLLVKFIHLYEQLKEIRLNYCLYLYDRIIFSMNMFKPTDAKTPQEYIDNLEEPRKSQIQQIHDFIRNVVPHMEPYIESGMIGYGKEHYKTKSGREGDWFTIGVSSRKNYISIYSCSTHNGKYIAESYIDKLPKASIGKSCIRFKKFEDIDWDVFEELLKESGKYKPFG